jgi:hypothetical protein
MFSGTNTPKIERSKYNKKKHAQLVKFFKYLQSHTVTASMASKAIRVPQKCLFRYKRLLEKNNHLQELYVGKCKLTGFDAAYLTTNKKLFRSKPQQTKLFEDGD